MADDIENIFKSSSKAELLEQLAEELKTHDKVVVVLIQDKEKGAYSSLTMTLGLSNTYEVYGILEVAKRDFAEEKY